MAKRYTIDELDKLKAGFEEVLFVRDTYFLLVDKQLTVRKTIMNAIIKAGIDKEHVLEAGDGMDALMEAGQNDQRFIILTELSLPDMKAVDMVTKLKTKKGHKDDIAIAVTGEKRKPELEAALQAGFTKILTKPVNIDELKDILTETGAL